MNETDAAWDSAEYNAKRAEQAEAEIERLRTAILDHCCSCGAGINPIEDHDQLCVAIEIINEERSAK